MPTKKPERRRKAPVDLAEVDMESPTPSQQSAKAGPGTGGGRERSRRVSERAPKTAGAKAHVKARNGAMSDKGVAKKAKADRRQLLSTTAVSATPAEAAPTQKQTLRDKPVRKRPLRNAGVDAAQ